MGVLFASLAAAVITFKLIENPARSLRLPNASNVCPAVVGNLLDFRDAQHLPADFSEWLTPMITSLLNKLEPGHAG